MAEPAAAGAPVGDDPGLARFQSLVHEAFERHAQRADALARAFRGAEPVPHLVLDDFLPEEVAARVEAAFPGPGAPWSALPTADQRGKLALRDERHMPASARALVHELHSGPFLELLERITGIRELIADTTLAGGGLHRIERGGSLSVHVDFSHHPRNGLNRRLNLLLFLNPGWREEYGGHFELWREDLSGPAVRIAPLYNRMALFATSSRSWHGHPEPLACPPGVARRSLALYYFSNGRDDEAAVHNTLFRSPPGRSTDLRTRLVRAASSGWVRELLPPLLYRGLRTAWNRGLRRRRSRARSPSRAS